MKRFRLTEFRGGCWLVAVLAGCLAARGEEKTAARKPITLLNPSRALENDKLFAEVDALPDDWREHPLAPALEYAHARHLYIRDQVRDFTCVLIKRERIEGRLRDYEYLATKVRRRQTDGQRVVQPLSVYTQYLAPAKVRGRQVLYVEGQNDGRMLVRKGGGRFNYVTLKVAPDSDAARRESRYPITELGLENVARRLIEKALQDIVHDPAGENTTVTFFRQASIDDRICTQIQVVHPQRDDGLGFHMAKIFVDDELHVPIRIEGYDWPEAEGDEPLLLEEYTYTRLKLNVGLTDADFSPTLLER